MNVTHGLRLSLIGLCCAACVAEAGNANQLTLATAIAPPPAVVDSILPMETMIARFQATMPHRPSQLEHAAASRKELIEMLASALRDSSATALQRLRLSVPEFAYLYFPSSHLAGEPYRQPPQLAWMLIEQNSAKGETRLLRRFGGSDVELIGHDCPLPPVLEGENRLWHGCTVRLAAPHGTMRLFGTIIERDGRFKFVSFANDL
jgi:hypothetical protein